MVQEMAVVKGKIINTRNYTLLDNTIQIEKRED